MKYISIIIVYTDGRHLTDWADNVDWEVFSFSIRERIRRVTSAEPAWACLAIGDEMRICSGPRAVRELLDSPIPLL
jgi:hypothetical protein